MKPQRIRLSRARGWRMPPESVKVDRTTKWGNPFIVGQHGTSAECVRLYKLLAAGYLCLSHRNTGEQHQAREVMMTAPDQLRGKNLACWCPLDQPCHADVLLEIANT